MRVKNNKETSDTWAGMTIEAGASYDLQTTEISKWQSDDKVISDIGSGDLLVGDGVTYKTSSSEAIKFLMGVLPIEVRVDEQPVFSSKKIGAKKLYTRATGQIFALAAGANTLDFTIPFNEVKFNGLEIDKSKFGEKVSLKILDTASGSISGVPNYVLNQFGFDINLPDGFYRRMSDYDADLFLGLQIRIEYFAVEARNIGVNYMLHELKL
jgi:hypothetical protein